MDLASRFRCALVAAAGYNSSLLFPTFNFFACSSFCCVEQIVDDDKFYASDNCKPFIFYENFIIVLAVVADEIDLSSNDCEPSLLPDFKFSLAPPDFFNYFSWGWVLPYNKAYRLAAVKEDWVAEDF